MPARPTILATILAAAAVPAYAQSALVCVNAGLTYKVGEFACIAACHGQRRLARCDAVAEKASWTYVSEICPSAMIVAPWPSDWTEIPVVTAMTPKPIVVNMSVPTPEMARRIAMAAGSGPALH